MSFATDAKSSQRLQIPPIEPHRVSIRYRFALAAVIGGLIALPLLYICIAAAITYGVYYHLAYDYAVIEAAKVRGILALIIYVGPAIVGTSLIVFMVRPLLARRQRAAGSYEITRDTEPAVFALLDQVADRLGSPRAARVHVDMQCNATAGLKPGIRALYRHEVILTLGLPLIAGFSVQELAGVLAHEFAHFAQGTAMRATYTIRVINSWISRVAYQSDIIEQRVSSYARRAGVYGWVIALGVTIAIRIARRSLHLLVSLSHAISCYSLRQMEYDADLYEAKLAGAECFARITARLHYLNDGFGRALYLLNRRLSAGAVAADFVAVIAERSHIAEAYDPWSPIADGNAPTSIFDTHPSPAERVAHVIRAGTSSTLADDSAASKLFSDFAALCRAITRQFYEHELGIDIQQVQFLEIDDFFRGETLTSDENEAVRRFFANRASPHRAARIDVSAVEGIETLEQQCAAALEHTTAAFERMVRLRRRRATLLRARALMSARLWFNPRRFNLTIRSCWRLSETFAQTTGELAAARRELAEFDRLAERRISAVLDMADAQTQGMLRTFRSMRDVWLAMPPLEEAVVCAGELAPTKPARSPNRRAHKLLVDYASTISKELTELRERMVSIPNPIHGGTVADEIRSRLPKNEVRSEDHVLREGYITLRFLNTFYYLLLGKLCVLAARRGAALALNHPRDIG